MICMMLPAELHLTADEARVWAEAQLKFQAEFDVQIPPKWQAGLTLAAVTFGTFKPKLGNLGRRARAQKEQAANPSTSMGLPAGLRPNMPPTHEQPKPAGPPGEGEVIRSGTALIMPTGVPDSGKIDFDGGRHGFEH